MMVIKPQMNDGPLCLRVHPWLFFSQRERGDNLQITRNTTDRGFFKSTKLSCDVFSLVATIDRAAIIASLEAEDTAFSLNINIQKKEGQV